jgi:hypothetical protein
MFYLYLSLIDPPHAALRASTNPFFAISLLRSKFGVDFGYHPLPIFSAKSIFQPQAASGRPRFFLSSRLTSSCPVSRLLSIGSTTVVLFDQRRRPLRFVLSSLSTKEAAPLPSLTGTAALFDQCRRPLDRLNQCCSARSEFEPINSDLVGSVSMRLSSSRLGLALHGPAQLMIGSVLRFLFPSSVSKKRDYWFLLLSFSLRLLFASVSPRTSNRVKTARAVIPIRFCRHPPLLLLRSCCRHEFFNFFRLRPSLVVSSAF